MSKQIYWITAKAVNIDGTDFKEIISRTIRALSSHTFITNTQIYSSQNEMAWSFMEGTENPLEIQHSIGEMIMNLGPKDWEVTFEVSEL